MGEPGRVWQELEYNMKICDVYILHFMDNFMNPLLCEMELRVCEKCVYMIV